MMKLPLTWSVYAWCTLNINEVIPDFHLHAVLIDTKRTRQYFEVRWSWLFANFFNM